MTARWKSLAMPMVPGVPEAIDAVTSAAETLSTALDLLAGLIDTLADLMALYVDPVQAALAALIEILQQLADQLNALLNGMIWFYLDKGPLFSGGQPDGLDGFISRWADSFDDAGDKQRPILPESTSVSAMFFVVGADNLAAFKTYLGYLAALFDIPALELPEDLEEDASDLQEALQRATSTPPDWRTLLTGQVLPPLKRLAETLEACAGMLVAPEAYAQVLQQLADIIAEKAEAMADLANRLQEVAAAIVAIIESTGIHQLVVQATGIPNLIEAARTAEDAPPFAVETWITGVCLLAATPNFAPLLTLLGEGE